MIRFDVEGDGTAQVIVDEFQAGEDDVGLLLILQYPPPEDEEGDVAETRSIFPRVSASPRDCRRACADLPG